MLELKRLGKETLAHIGTNNNETFRPERGPRDDVLDRNVDGWSYIQVANMVTQFRRRHRSVVSGRSKTWRAGPQSLPKWWKPCEKHVCGDGNRRQHTLSLLVSFHAVNPLAHAWNHSKKL